MICDFKIKMNINEFKDLIELYNSYNTHIDEADGKLYVICGDIDDEDDCLYGIVFMNDDYMIETISYEDFMKLQMNN